MPIDLIVGISVSLVLGLPLLGALAWSTPFSHRSPRPARPEPTDLPGRKDTWFLPTDRIE